MEKTLSASDFLVSPPNLYNMGGLNPHISKKPLFWAGFDWLTINLQIEWDSWLTDRIGGTSLKLKLEDLANTARERGEPVEVEEWGGKIHPGGGKIGGVKYCKFKIERADSIILIADAQKYAGDWPNVKVEISGERCLVYPGGATAAYRSAMLWLEEIGANIHKERVSRADICADFPGLSMDTFYAAYEKKWWTCRSNRRRPDISNGISLYFGSSDIVLRIYDKLAEMRASALRGQPAKYEHMCAKRWGGHEPESAVRVEYQLRRDWLKLHGADTVDDLTRLAPDFVGYLTGAHEADPIPFIAAINTVPEYIHLMEFEETRRWFRFLTRKADNKHPERNKTLPDWVVVQEAFADVFRLSESIIEIDPNRADIETLLKQAFGVLECAACNKGYEVPGKTSAAPELYRFENYAHFEKWAVVMLRNIAAQSGRWDMKESEHETALAAELEFIEKRINQRSKDNE
jgi:hypothetical protein